MRPRPMPTRLLVPLAAALVAGACLVTTPAARAAQPELSVADFTFDGPLGCQGATIEKLATNHFKATLGHAPKHKDWNNKLQFQITRHAKGNTLRLDVTFPGGKAYRLNEYFHSWSYDAKDWHPIRWQKGTGAAAQADTLVFPTFTQDTVHVGHQVPMSYENVVELMETWRKHPHVAVRVLGKSLGGRNIYRAEITDPQSPHPRSRRWVHYFANQHPGEHNSQWRMAGMADWLLSDAGADCRRRSICHVVLLMSPDAPTHGWYRVNAQGVDMNRSYRPKGSDKATQAHEACIAQRDLEALMASDAPVTTCWSMHTWGGKVDPLITPGPEIGTTLGPWTELRDAIKRNDPTKLVKTLRTVANRGHAGYWTDGPNTQFGITVVLCEGAGGIVTKADNLESGRVLMKSIAQYYKATRPPAAKAPAR